jgi:hexosaminidase
VSNKITINATTDLGALHGLETLLQLMQNNGSSFIFRQKLRIRQDLPGED